MAEELDPDIDINMTDEEVMSGDVEDPLDVEETFDEADSIAMDVAIKAPVIYSWGRSDTRALLRSQNEAQAVDGVQALTFANQRTIMQISSNLYHSSAITSTGELYTGGANDEGEVQPSEDTVSADQKEHGDQRPRIVEELGNHRICLVSCGLYHTVCLTASGLAISFGGNESGQCGHSGTKHTRVPPKVVDFTNRERGSVLIKQIASGDLFTVFLTTSGEVYTCGAGLYMGSAKWRDMSVPRAERMDSLLGSNIVYIAAGARHAFALTSAGEVYGWGNGKFGQLGLGDDVFDLEGCHVQTPLRLSTVLPPDAGNIVGVSAGQSHSLFWTDGGVLLGCGSNKYGQLTSHSPRIAALEVLPIPGGPEFCLMAACGQNHSLVLIRDSNVSTGHGTDIEGTRVLAFGSNNFGQVDGSSSASMFRTPIDITRYISPARLLYVAAGGDQSFAVGVLRDLDSTPDSVTPFQVPGQGQGQGRVVSTSTWMKRQFSTRLSSAPSAMSTNALLAVLTRALDASRAPMGSEALLTPAISTACELLSLPSLLAGSFIDPKGPLQVDVEGVEACYIALMQMGKASVVRMIAAMTKSLKDLVLAGSSAADPSSSSSSSSSSATSTVTTPTHATSSSSIPHTAGTTQPPGVEGKADPPLQLTLPNSVTRIILILWQCPASANTTLSEDSFYRLIRLFLRLPPSQSSMVLKAIQSYPSHLFASRFLKPLQEHLSLQMLKDANAKRIPTYCETITMMYRMNKDRADKVHDSLFNNIAVSGLTEESLVTDYNAWRELKVKRAHSPYEQPTPRTFHYSDYPCLLSPEAKKRLILAKSKRHQMLAQHVALSTAHVTGVLHPFFVMFIDREKLLQTALSQIMAASDDDLTKPLRVVFINEEAIDEGGVRKEFFQLLVAQLFSLEFGMFVPTADQRSIWMNQCCLWSGEEYRLVGVLLGLAVYNNVLLDIHLPKVMFRKLLKIEEFELSDIISIDPLLYEGLVKMLEFSPPEAVEDVFCRTFEVEWEEYGAIRKHDLIPSGGSIPVTGENRVEYVKKLVKWILVESVRQQFQDLYAGFSRVINPDWILLFSGDDLELLMVGTPHLDFKELELNTSYLGGDDWNASNPTIAAFWSVVHDMTHEEKQKLLLFVTGSNKAPIGGLGKLGFKIQRMGPDSPSLPTAHTCFDVILLPEYGTREKTKERLLTAINECEGFGLK